MGKNTSETQKGLSETVQAQERDSVLQEWEKCADNWDFESREREERLPSSKTDLKKKSLVEWETDSDFSDLVFADERAARMKGKGVEPILTFCKLYETEDEIVVQQTLRFPKAKKPKD
jgi:hypothetical protein